MKEIKFNETSVRKKVIGVFKAIGLMLLFITIWLIFSMILIVMDETIFGHQLDLMDPGLEMGYEGFLQAIALAITSVIFYYLFKSKATIGEGWPKIKSSIIGFKNGVLVGLFMAGGMFLLTYIFGGGQFSLDGNSWSDYFYRILPLLLFIFITTLFEEGLFRGYPLTILAKATSPGWANVVLSLLFALVHISSPGYNGLVALNIFFGSLVVGSLRFF